MARRDLPSTRRLTAIRVTVDLLSPTEGAGAIHEEAANCRANTEFVMMAIDDSKPELEDVRGAISEAFGEFGVRAVAANEIEHNGMITDRVLEEIRTSEFLIADMTHERPNVYYEVGYAHACDKPVMLFRKKGTRLHFDLVQWNCPQYDNTTNLKTLLRARLESMIGHRRSS